MPICSIWQSCEITAVHSWGIDEKTYLPGGAKASAVYVADSKFLTSACKQNKNNYYILKLYKRLAGSISSANCYIYALFSNAKIDHVSKYTALYTYCFKF